MPLHSALDGLAKRIHERRNNPSVGPYILFLGAGTAHGAGVPSVAQLARMALELSRTEFDPAAKDEEVTERFHDQVESMRPEHVARMLQRLYAATPIPTFYQYLAQLVRERFFPLILTTNWDTFLEQALGASGLRQPDYRVTTFGRHIMSTSTGGNPNHLTHIVKLHGDIARDVVHLTPDQVDAALRESRQFIKSELRGDLIMVGYSFDDDSINRWLMHAPQRELWWVSPQPPQDPSQFDAWTNEAHFITGDDGRPQVFISQLAPRLLQPQFGPDDDEGNLALEGIVLEGLESLAPAEEPAQALQSEIKRAQAVLVSLEQEAPPERRPHGVQAQIAYQKKQVSRLEEKMRTLPDVKPRLVELVSKIGDSVHRAGDTHQIDFALRQYLDSQIATVRTEIEKEKPNQLVITASLGATLTLADRLCTEYGADVVDPEHVRELASFAPMVAGKVVF